MKYYVDNDYNRRAGRVGLLIGSCVINRAHEYLGEKRYVDNAYNRKLGRVGQFRGSCPPWMCDDFSYIPEYIPEDFSFPFYEPFAKTNMLNGWQPNMEITFKGLGYYNPCWTTGIMQEELYWM